MRGCREIQCPGVQEFPFGERQGEFGEGKLSSAECVPLIPRTGPQGLGSHSMSAPLALPFIPGMCPSQSLGSNSSLAWLPELSQSPQVSPAGKELLLQVPVMGSCEKTKDRMDFK